MSRGQGLLFAANCFEKQLELIAQAFQPVRINEAGEDARPTDFS